MFQCVLCEDWYHDKCFNLNWKNYLDEKESTEDFNLICRNCTKANPTLGWYSKDINEIEMVKEGIKQIASKYQSTQVSSSEKSTEDSGIGAKRKIEQIEKDSKNQSELEVTEPKPSIDDSIKISKPEDNDKVIEIPKNIKCFNLSNEFLDISNFDIIFNAELVDHLCFCLACKDKSEWIINQINETKNTPEDQQELEAILNGKFDHDDLIEQLDDNPENDNDTTDYNKFFTEACAKEYPHVTPDKRFEIFNSFQEKLKDLVEYVCLKTKDSEDKTIKEEHVLEYLKMNNLERFIPKK